VAAFRAAPLGAKLDDDWSKDIQADYKNRSGKR